MNPSLWKKCDEESKLINFTSHFYQHCYRLQKINKTLTKKSELQKYFYISIKFDNTFCAILKKLVHQK